MQRKVGLYSPFLACFDICTSSLSFRMNLWTDCLWVKYGFSFFSPGLKKNKNVCWGKKKKKKGFVPEMGSLILETTWICTGSFPVWLGSTDRLRGRQALLHYSASPFLPSASSSLHFLLIVATDSRYWRRERAESLVSSETDLADQGNSRKLSVLKPQVANLFGWPICPSVGPRWRIPENLRFQMSEQIGL